MASASAGLALCVGALAGCGSAYRPVVATVGLVGPAGQPTKYAVAVSTPTKIPASGPIAFVGAWSSTTTYSINQGVSYAGSQYVSLQNANLNQNPASAAKYWAPLSNGLVTIVDFSGDTVLVTAELGLNPYYLALNSQGSAGFTLNSDKTVTSFGVSTSLISSQVLETTLLPGANPASLFASSTNTYIPDPGVNAVDQLVGAPPALKQELPIASGYTPIYVVGQSGSPRAYAISPAANGGPGQVSAIETTGNTISTTLTVGSGPVYGVMTLDDRRAFILNQTDGTVSVINVQNNALDQFGPTITGFSIAGNVVTFTAQNSLSPGASVTIAGLSTGTYLNGQTLAVLATGLSSTQFEAAFTHANVGFTTDLGTASIADSAIAVGPRPVWADLASGLDELVVVNEGNGTTPGSVSLVNIPLCSATALQTNPDCDPANPVDATTFGTAVGPPIQVGVNPVMVSVLSDYSRAYVANAGNATTPGSVSVVNLTSNTVTATIPIPGNGHPAWIATSNAAPTGKVYVVCNDSQVMTVIETDTDSVDTTIPLQGYGVSVRMTAP
jgi:DNA-binding beta-propeller fold protein YncE